MKTRRLLALLRAMTFGAMAFGMTALGAISSLGCRESEEPSAAASREERPGRPNIVLVVADTLRADKMSCYGFGESTSPELDRFAEQGILFDRVVAQSSWTRPSIGSMLTSRYPRTLGLYKEKAEVLSAVFPALPTILRQHGYATIGITANPNINSAFGFDQGFDEYIDSHVVFSWMNREKDQIPHKVNRLMSATDVFGKALELVRSGDRFPYYLQLNIMEMHERHRGRYSLNRPEFEKEFRSSPNHRYLRALRQISYDTDQFVRSLLKMPGWSNTLFVFVGDHGEGLDDHPNVKKSRSHGLLLYESQVIVPLIMYHPARQIPVRRINQPIRLLELMPTLLDYLGVPVPQGLDGQSVWPVITGSQSVASLPEVFITETRFRGREKIAAYAKDWKYIENRDSHPGLDAWELQARGRGENGRRTDQRDLHEATVERLREYIKAWEAAHPEATPTRPGRALSDEELRQLKAIGYVGN